MSEAGSFLTCDCGRFHVDLDKDADARYYRRVFRRTMERFEEAGVRRLQIITVSRPNVETEAVRGEIRVLRAACREFFHDFLSRYSVTGAIPVLEVTDCVDDWHVHLHILCEDTYVPWGDAWDYWERVSGGRNQVDFSRSDHKPMDLKRAANYCLKYLTKSREDESLHAVLGRSHRYSVLGDFRLAAHPRGPPMYCGGCWSRPHWSPVRRYPPRSWFVVLDIEDPAPPPRSIPWRRTVRPEMLPTTLLTESVNSDLVVNNVEERC